MDKKRSGTVNQLIQAVLSDLRIRGALLKEICKDRAADISSSVRETLIDLKCSISSVLYYLPVIWKSRDYDHGYCLKLYIHSLKRLKKGLENSEVRDNSKEVNQLKLIIKMLSSYNKDEELKSTTELKDKLLKKYNLQQDDLDFDFENREVSRPGFYRVKFKYESKLPADVLPDFQKEYRDILFYDENQKQLYFKKALIMIYQKSATYWD